ncbi:MAG: phosphate/phosphite/phosphonate ABC transporter substrate-binding protein [Rhodospirillales bacterium]
MGRVSGNPQRHFEAVKALADYLAENLDGDSPVTGEALIAADLDSMSTHLQNGTVDMISETPFGALALVESAGAEIVLREWKGGVPSYRSVVFVRAESQLESIEDLPGHIIAFEDAGSTSAFLVPYAVLRDRGLNLTQLVSPRETPPSDTIGYAFAEKELNIAHWVVSGVTDAGSFSDSDWEELAETSPEMRENLKIIHTTEPIIRSLVVVPGDMPEARKRDLKRVLLGMATSAAGKAVLERYYKVRKFDEITGEAASDLEWIRRLYERAYHEVN